MLSLHLHRFCGEIYSFYSLIYYLFIFEGGVGCTEHCIKDLHAEQSNGPGAILSTLLFLFSLKNYPYVTADDAAVDLSETMTSSPWPWQWSRTHETHSILAPLQSET